jgi:2-polyprenyl-3-methyl-5-hydroxy-6-metoxy-1,4-benzoquinol methylase
MLWTKECKFDTFKYNFGIMPIKHSVVDLFCGIGGLTHGFVQEKFKVVAGIDFDNSCKYAYEKTTKLRLFIKICQLFILLK